MAESWTSNADASEWTIHFRDGLKWSDGTAFTVDDILFWWQDIVVPGHYAQTPPDWCRSAKLSDVSTLSKFKAKASYDILLWNSGSGTGSIFFLNLDYPDDELRTLFNKPKFRQAISYAVDRNAIQRAIYYTTGAKTTGTVSPQTTEFHTGSQGPRIYQQWRDSYVQHNPKKAKQLLAQLGLKDNDGDGFVELPSGKKLTVRIDYKSDISPPEAEKDDQLVSDCKKIGLRVTRHPISSATYVADWQAGKLMAQTNWEASNVASILVQPFWLLPIENQRWAPLEGEYYALQGTSQANKRRT